MTIEILVPLIIILVFGLPHGAADGILAYRIMSSKPIKFLFFLFSYIIAGIMVILIWIFFPLTSLTVFLFISCIHFGILDSNTLGINSFQFLRIMVHGSTIVLIIPVAHPTEVKILFDLLVGNDTTIIFTIINVTLYIWIAGATILILFTKSQRSRIFFEISIVAGLAIVLPPLWGFAVYFCIIHSFRHFKNIWLIFREQYTENEAIILILGISLISVSLVISVAWFTAYDNLTNSLIRSTFIGLAAFTVPHVLFIDAFGVINQLNKRKN